MASELHPLRFELKIWFSRLPWAPLQTHGASSFFKVGYPVGTQKPNIQMQTFLTWNFVFMLLFFSGKKSKPVGRTRTLYLQTGENTNWAETFVWCLLLIFKVAYQDPLTQLLPFTWDFVVKGSGWSGTKWVNKSSCLLPYMSVLS